MLLVFASLHAAARHVPPPTVLDAIETDLSSLERAPDKCCLCADSRKPDKAACMADGVTRARKWRVLALGMNSANQRCAHTCSDMSAITGLELTGITGAETHRDEKKCEMGLFPAFGHVPLCSHYGELGPVIFLDTDGVVLPKFPPWHTAERTAAAWMEDLLLDKDKWAELEEKNKDKKTKKFKDIMGTAGPIRERIVNALNDKAGVEWDPTHLFNTNVDDATAPETWIQKMEAWIEEARGQSPDADDLAGGEIYKLEDLVDGVTVLLKSSTLDFYPATAFINLKRLQDQTGARVVISSSWRLVPWKLPALKGALEHFRIRLHADDTTPVEEDDMGSGGKYTEPETMRVREVMLWLQAHPPAPGVPRQFVMLDDVEAFFALARHFKDSLVTEFGPLFTEEELADFDTFDKNHFVRTHSGKRGKLNHFADMATADGGTVRVDENWVVTQGCPREGVTGKTMAGVVDGLNALASPKLADADIVLKIFNQLGYNAGTTTNMAVGFNADKLNLAREMLLKA